MSPKVSPGPWQLETNNGTLSGNKQLAYVITDPDHWIVALVNAPDDFLKGIIPGEGNARLLAASWELLQLVREARDAIPTLPAGHPALSFKNRATLVLDKIDHGDMP